jgi:hypothetical protein
MEGVVAIASIAYLAFAVVSFLLLIAIGAWAIFALAFVVIRLVIWCARHLAAN